MCFFFSREGLSSVPNQVPHCPTVKKQRKNSIFTKDFHRAIKTKQSSHKHKQEFISA